MIRNAAEIERARRKHQREHPLTLEEKFQIWNMMYQEAKDLGRLDDSKPSLPEKHKLEMARILNTWI